MMSLKARLVEKFQRLSCGWNRQIAIKGYWVGSRLPVRNKRWQDSRVWDTTNSREKCHKMTSMNVMGKNGAMATKNWKGSDVRISLHIHWTVLCILHGQLDWLDYLEKLLPPKQAHKLYKPKFSSVKHIAEYLPWWNFKYLSKATYMMLVVYRGL